MWISKKKLEKLIDIQVDDLEDKISKVDEWQRNFEEDWHEEMLARFKTLARLEIRCEEITKEQKRSTDLQERWLKAFCKHAGVSLEGE